MSELMSKNVSKLGESIVKSLSDKYGGFSVEEGMKHLSMEVNSKNCVEKKVIIPWCGEICEDKCRGVRLNHGLYTQCMNEKKDKDLCKTCMTQSLKTLNREPPYGLINERLLKGSEYVDPKGKRPVNYGNVMIKLDITREEAEMEAKRQGLKIAEEDYIVKKGNRGRPKKFQSARDISDVGLSGTPLLEEEEEKPKKGRGRPKKNKEIVEGENHLTPTRRLEEGGVVVDPREEGDLLCGTTEEGDLLCGTTEEGGFGVPPIEEEEEVEVKEFKFNKKLYYRNPVNNALYDPKSYEHIGTWDEENEKIVDVEDDDDE